MYYVFVRKGWAALYTYDSVSNTYTQLRSGKMIERFVGNENSPNFPMTYSGSVDSEFEVIEIDINNPNSKYKDLYTGIPGLDKNKPIKTTKEISMDINGDDIPDKVKATYLGDALLNIDVIEYGTLKPDYLEEDEIIYGTNDPGDTTSFSVNERMKSFRQTVDKLNARINNFRPVYTQYLYFEVNNNVLIDTTSKDWVKNNLVSFSMDMNGSGQANTFTIDILFVPFGKGNTHFGL